MKYKNTIYEPKEELWNVITHGFGLLLSLIALGTLVYASIHRENIWTIVGFTIYGSSLVLLYLASTLYHLSSKPKRRYRLNIFDHSAIYVLIAGTYTPLMLITLKGVWGWSLLTTIWSLAIIGIVLKIFFIGKFNKISTWAYVLMGWIAIVAVYPLTSNLSTSGLLWLIIGGVFYSIGAFFYQRSKLKFNHAIFHVFVLLGSISHFACIFFHV